MNRSRKNLTFALILSVFCGFAIANDNNSVWSQSDEVLQDQIDVIQAQADDLQTQIDSISQGADLTDQICNVYDALLKSEGATLTAMPDFCLPPVEDKFVFVTSGVWTGFLNGATGADQKCQNEADAEGLPGVYKAWVAGSARDEPALRFTRSSGRYIRTDGEPVAMSWADLTDGSLMAPINIAADGVTIMTGYAWSNVRYDGRAHHEWEWASVSPAATLFTAVDWKLSGSCKAWYSYYQNLVENLGVIENYGHVATLGETDLNWSMGTHIRCNTTARLMCFQQ